MTAMKWLDRFSTFVNRVLVWFAGLALLALLLLTVTDMTLRASGVTLAGSYEVIGWLSACAMALALGAVQQHKGHVSVQLLENRFGPRLKAAVDLLTCLLSLLLFVAVAWYVAKYGQVLQRTGSLSETLRVVVYPWVYVVAVGCAGLALSLLADFVRAAINLFVPHGRS